MKILLTVFCVFSLLFSGCKENIELEPIPARPRVDKTVEPPTNKTIARGNNTALKAENIIPADETTCPIESGCPIKDGVCKGCVVKKRDITTLDFNAGTLKTGEYKMTTVMEHTGKITRWTVPLNMSLRNISGKTYLMTFSGIGEVDGKIVDCSSPHVSMFVLNENNIETSFKKLDGGSCPNIVSANWKVKWESNEHGLKKMKSYSNGGCVVGPCDWISTMINVYFYERI